MACKEEVKQFSVKHCVVNTCKTMKKTETDHPGVKITHAVDQISDIRPITVSPSVFAEQTGSSTAC